MIDRYKHSIYYRGDMRWLFPLAVVATVAMVCLTHTQLGTDYWSYVCTFGDWVDRGELGERMPLYPLLAGGAYRAFGIAGYKWVTMVQGLVFMLTVPCLYRTALALTPRWRWLAVAVTLLYIFYPLTLGYVTLINSEPLSIYFMVVYIYYCQRALATGAPRYGVASGVMLLMQIALRPSCQVLLLSTVVLLALLTRRHYRRAAAALTVMVAVTVAAGMVYSVYMERKYQFRGLSVVPVTNQYYMLRHHTGWDVSTVSDTAVRSQLARFLPRAPHYDSTEWADDTITHIEDPTFERLGLSRLNKAIVEVYAANPGLYCHMVGSQFQRQVWGDYVKGQHEDWTTAPSQWAVNKMGFHLAVSTLALLMLALGWRRVRSRALVGVLLLVTWPTMLMIIVGAPIEWGRLACSLVPLDWLLLAWLVASAYGLWRPKVENKKANADAGI